MVMIMIQPYVLQIERQISQSFEASQSNSRGRVNKRHSLKFNFDWWKVLKKCACIGLIIIKNF